MWNRYRNKNQNSNGLTLLFKVDALRNPIQSATRGLYPAPRAPGLRPDADRATAPARPAHGHCTPPTARHRHRTAEHAPPEPRRAPRNGPPKPKNASN
ncbi:hypothetical protein EVAR_44761_1 [Eumeta japonica]|uniref:Uncharacterized protein n=1 Tax=Eumeta variegata TaxID=151549 RepID=A0A4C1XF16_EUMVA|nr:hypothetical protein EVAR_44761_1 [Eumeta japonica]